MYRDVYSVPVSGYFHQELNGIKCHYETSREADSILAHSIFIAVDPLHVAGGRDDVLTEISDSHGRSYELNTGNEIFLDEYDHVYSSISLKGTNLTEPRLRVQSIAPSGFTVLGVQDSDALFRCLYASQLLRSHGVDAEYIVRVFEPDTLPFLEEFQSIDTFKELLVHSFLEKILTRGNTTLIAERMQEITEYLNNTSFVITARATDVAERMSDFTKARTIEEFNFMLERIFKYVNAEYGICQGISKNLDIKNQEDIQYFFGSYLPKRMGKNFGILHSLGLIMKYTHTGNITAAGGICDLDSIKGENLHLHDIPNAPLERNIDLETMFTTIGGWPPLLDILYQLQEGGFLQKGNNDVVIQFRNNFFIEYVKHLGDPKDHGLLSVLPVLYTVFFDFHGRETVKPLAVFLDRLAEEMGVTYELPEEFSFEFMLKNFTHADIHEIMQIDYLDDEITEGRDKEAFNRFLIYRDGKITDYLKEQWADILVDINENIHEFVARNVPNLFADREFIIAEQFANDNPEWLKMFEEEVYRLRTSNV